MGFIKGFFMFLGAFITAISVLIASACGILTYQNQNYWKYAKPGGVIEEKYTALGKYEVSAAEYSAAGAIWDKYHIWYPSELENSSKKYPLVIMANGTGVGASKYKEVFKHLASWGFIVAGNEDENSRSGASSAATLDFLLALNTDSSSQFCGKIDTDNIGIGGHSQGGVGAINAVTQQANGNYYKALYMASATSPYWGQDAALGTEWSYDSALVKIPCFIVAGTGAADAGTANDITATEGQGIAPLWGMLETYKGIDGTVDKIMARQVGKDHGDILRSANGYMIAWFMYYLQADVYAGKAFWGEDAEILHNPQWQDVNKNK